MPNWKVDKRKMYAHIYFDLPQDSLGIAVYALGKVPGFAKKLDPELAEATGKSRARDAFLQILGKDDITPDELQLGKTFKFEDIKDRLNQLELLGQQIAKDEDADISVNLDDPMFWFEAKFQDWTRSQQQVAQQLPDAQKIQIGTKHREDEMGKELGEATTAEELEEALQRLYVYVSRKIHPSTGPKDFPGNKSYPKPTPPAFLASEEMNLVYYPGFRGAQWMGKAPEPGASRVYPMGKEEEVPSDQKWQTILIPDCKAYTEVNLQQIDVRTLDQISEILAKMFFNNLPQTEMNIMAFNQSVEPIKEKAKSILSRLGEQQKELIVASMEVGTWIHLGTGKTYDNEEDLLSDLEEVQEELPLAASINLRKVARILLKRDQFDLYKKVMKRYE